MKILLTNDDGTTAPGILALRSVAAQLGDPVILAPHQHLSGCSHRVTTDGPIRLEEISPDHYSLEGTPADCVRVALLELKGEFDWVFCGINDGGNLGVDVFMSGTVGGAREATLWGKKAVAVSQYRKRSVPFEWSQAAELTMHVLQQLIRRPLPARCFWNVNLPAVWEGPNLPDVVFCPLDPYPLPVAYERINGALHYRSVYHERKRKPGADVDVCFSGRIAVSLLSVDPA